jgi:Membrane bound FAD containing D-sorbitol dehydrogenase
MSKADDFFALSKLLIGKESLDREVSDAYLGRIQAAFPDACSALLTTFRGLAGTPDLGDALLTELEQHQDQAEVARQVVTVWYTSQFTKADKSIDPPGDVGQYQSALLWKVIRAHPPAVSTGPYGYWEFI